MAQKGSEAEEGEGAGIGRARGARACRAGSACEGQEAREEKDCTKKGCEEVASEEEIEPGRTNASVPTWFLLRTDNRELRTVIWHIKKGKALHAMAAIRTRSGLGLRHSAGRSCPAVPSLFDSVARG